MSFRCVLFTMIVLSGSLVWGCSVDKTAESTNETVSPYLFVFAGDRDEKDSDFIMTIDVDPNNETRGQPISSLPIGHRNSMPHHTEYVLPPNDEHLFMNAIIMS